MDGNIIPYDMSRKEENYEMYTRKQPTGFVEYPKKVSFLIQVFLQVLRVCDNIMT